MSLPDALARATARVAELRAENGWLPHITGEDARWVRLSPVGAEDEALTGLPWTGGFVAGQLWLAAHLPGHASLAG